MTNQPITPELLEALDKLKDELDLASDYALCQKFKVPRPTMHQWRHGREGRTMGVKWWKIFKPYLEPYLDGTKKSAEIKYDTGFAKDVLSALDRGEIEFAKSMLRHIIKTGVKK